MKKMQKLMDNVYIYAIGTKFMTIGAGIFYSVLYSRYLGPELKGVSSVINSYISMLTIVGCMGTYQAYPYYQKQGVKNVRSEYCSVINTMLLVNVIEVFIIICAFSADINLIIALLLGPVSVMVQEYNYISLIDNPNRKNKWAIFQAFAEVIFIIVFFLCVKKSWKAMVLTILGKYVIDYIVAYLTLKEPIFTRKPDFKLLLKYVKYGFIPMCTILCMTINYDIDILMLKGKVPMEDIGIYSLGINLAQYLWLIPDTLKDILLSRLTKGKKEDEVATLLRISLLVMSICIIGVIIFGKPVIRIIYGEAFQDSYKITMLVLLGVFSMIFYKIIYSYNVVMGRKSVNLIFLLIAAIVNVVGNYIVIPFYGIYGAGAISVLSYSICGLLFLADFLKQSKVTIGEVLFINGNDINNIRNLIGIKK